MLLKAVDDYDLCTNLYVSIVKGMSPGRLTVNMSDDSLYCMHACVGGGDSLLGTLISVMIYVHT